MSNAECYERMLAGDDFDYPITKPTKHVQRDVKNKTCNTCIKSDVCVYKQELKLLEEGITGVLNSISTNIFEVSTSCKKWVSNISVRNNVNNRKMSLDKDGGIR